MGILTNFLKLLKPEPNDFVDVAKHISENYDKLDENAKSNDETLTNLSNNKLDKGTYPGDAGDLKAEIDGKVSKSGGALSGNISIRNDTNPVVNFDTATGSYQGFVGRQSNSIRLYNNISKKIISLGDDGSGVFHATNLNTTSKEVVGAINELDEQDKGVLGGYNGKFPLTVAYKNGIYLLPATNKFYVCVENYSGSSLTAPNANFEELSVFQNRNKLENLFTFEEKNRYTSLSNFDYINATIYKISKLCICYIRYEYQGVLPKIKIPFPITFVRPPIVTMVDNDTEMGSAYNNIAIGWPTTSDVEVKGTIQGATLILIGQFIS
ncbi:hypothetical protein [Fusobacterium sp.]|uniref:hypothetical protein n=1 Tax=Fusobacterium sp. TaxID=68766 RepID=UPI000E8F8C74|nr:hypothetical protein [Fusobacterium sp.]HBJ77938.1 hypothetical protein [Fusobacterium sp.]